MGELAIELRDFPFFYLNNRRFVPDIAGEIWLPLPLTFFRSRMKSFIHLGNLAASAIDKSGS
jgi:hypothetical protein